uniref:Wsv192-like protein n=1 Tax=Metapenaeus ensis majanivirus TaxID=2984279 RepID=A0A9C7BW53_9VIRU|nr:MAG: wsv192-like protein [Metapenaeus ensis majanivirus]
MSNVRMDILIETQQLKERKTFLEREWASKVNWYNLIHFLFPNLSCVKNKLLNLSRARIMRISQFLVHYEYFKPVLSNIEFKFNSDMLPLGCKENIFMRLKIGLDIIAHATKCWNWACLQRGWISETIENPTPDWVIQLAQQCFQECNIKCEDIEKDCSYIKSPCLLAYRNVVPLIKKDIQFIQDDRLSSFEFWVELSLNSLVDALRMKKIITENEKDLSNLETLINVKTPDTFEKLLCLMKIKCEKMNKAFVSKKGDTVDISRWSKKNNGINGKRCIEIKTNSLIEIQNVTLDGKEFSLYMVESQNEVRKQNVEFVEIKKCKSKIYVKAPCISPLYQRCIKPVSLIIRPKP